MRAVCGMPGSSSHKIFGAAVCFKHCRSEPVNDSGPTASKCSLLVHDLTGYPRPKDEQLYLRAKSEVLAQLDVWVSSLQSLLAVHLGGTHNALSLLPPTLTH